MKQSALPDNALFEAGFNLQAVFNLADLPAPLVKELEGCSDKPHRYKQLILLGHGGRQFWATLKASGFKSDNPVDDFTLQTVGDYFARLPGGPAYAFLFPGEKVFDLMALGRLAGWHHATPFMVGINQTWGSWFAYRAVLLTDTDFAASKPLSGVSPFASPCAACDKKPCIPRCPAGAMDGTEFSLTKCVTYRKGENSLCRDKCISRIVCPIATEHRYDADQINYHYGRSLRMIIEEGY